MKENKISITSILFVILLFVFNEFGREPLTEKILPSLFTVDGWKRIANSPDINWPFSVIEYNSDEEVLWLMDSREVLIKFDLVNSKPIQEINSDFWLIPKFCDGQEDIFLYGVGKSYIIDKANFELTTIEGFNDQSPFGCLVGTQGEIITFAGSWVGTYKQKSWQLNYGLYWNHEKVDIYKIIGPYNNDFFVISDASQLFTYSPDSDELAYIGEIPIDINSNSRNGIFSDHLLWLEINDHFYAWNLPFDENDLTPDIELQVENKGESNFFLNAFIDQDERIWIIKLKEIYVLDSQGEQIPIILPYHIDQINAAYIDEYSNDLFIGTENGVFRSNLDVLFEFNAPKD